MKHSSFQREGHSLIALRTIEAHQETTCGQIKGMQALHTPWSLSATPPLNHCSKPPHQIPPVWDTQFLGREPTVSPFARQSNKTILFYFTQKSVSEIQFGTGAQRLSFQHQYQEVSVGHKCCHITPWTWPFLDVSMQILEKSSPMKIMEYSRLLIRYQMVYEACSKTTDFHFFDVKQTADMLHYIFSH